MKKLFLILFLNLILISNYAFANAINFNGKEFRLAQVTKIFNGYKNKYIHVLYNNYISSNESITVMRQQNFKSAKDYIEGMSLMAQRKNNSTPIVTHKDDYSLTMFCISSGITNKKMTCEYIKAQIKNKDLYSLHYTRNYSYNTSNHLSLISEIQNIYPYILGELERTEIPEIQTVFNINSLFSN